jgi:diaminopimelate epimerase
MRFTKHHGLGNDFLVLLDATGDAPLDAELVRRLCARHHGIGADGVLRARPTPTEGVDAVMELHNADGSRAEMSGNGIRCLVQALLLGGWATGPEVVVATDAGVRVVTVEDARRHPGQPVAAGTQVLSVDMGAARIGGDAPEWLGGDVVRAGWVDMGNPHLVLQVDRASAVPDDELVVLGEKVNVTAADGANVHVLVAGPGVDAVGIRTYERGVGLTQACGTGACGSAALARHWGLVGERVVVHMPGGTAEVTLGPTVRLTGPAVAIAAVDHPWPPADDDEDGGNGSGSAGNA